MLSQVILVATDVLLEINIVSQWEKNSFLLKVNFGNFCLKKFKFNYFLNYDFSGAYIPADCTDNPFFANCKLIVQANYCNHKYYAKFCCKSCTMAGLLQSRAN